MGGEISKTNWRKLSKQQQSQVNQPEEDKNN